MNPAIVEQLVKSALAELAPYLAGNCPLEEGMTDHQLASCKRELEEMLEELGKTDLPSRKKRDSGMGRMIIDSWPFGTSVGEAILKAQSAYSKL